MVVYNFFLFIWSQFSERRSIQFYREDGAKKKQKPFQYYNKSYTFYAYINPACSYRLENLKICKTIL